MRDRPALLFTVRRQCFSTKWGLDQGKIKIPAPTVPRSRHTKQMIKAPVPERLIIHAERTELLRRYPVASSHELSLCHPPSMSSDTLKDLVDAGNYL